MSDTALFSIEGEELSWRMVVTLTEAAEILKIICELKDGGRR